jgi:hypothetical protein
MVVAVPLTLDGPNISWLLLKGVNVNHPSENLGDELSPSGIAVFLGCDRTA